MFVLHPVVTVAAADVAGFEDRVPRQLSLPTRRPRLRVPDLQVRVEDVDGRPIDAVIGYDGVVVKFGVDTCAGFGSRAPTGDVAVRSPSVGVAGDRAGQGLVPNTSVKFDMPGRSYAAREARRGTRCRLPRGRGWCRRVRFAPAADHAAPMLGAKLLRSVLYVYWPCGNWTNVGFTPPSVPGLKMLLTPEMPQTLSSVAVV